MAERKDNKGRILKQGESQRKDGRYQYRYKNNDGKYEVVYSLRLTPNDKPQNGDRDLSLREKEKIIQKKLAEGLATSSSITVYEMMRKYLSLKPNLSISTSYNYNKICESIIRKYPDLAEKKIINVKKSDILAFYNYLSKECNYKNTTIQLVQNVVYPTFQLAVDDDIIKKNPCTGCMKDFPQNDKGEKYALTESQEKIFLNFVKNSKLYSRYYPMLLLALETGMRCGEFIGLTWDDINYEEGYIDINHQMQYKKFDGKFQHRITCVKTKASLRKIPFNENILEALKLQKIQQQEHQVNILPEKSITIPGYRMDNRNKLIFTTFKGTPYKGLTLNRVLNSIVRDYNYSEINIANTKGIKPELLPHLSVHILRHTACTKMARSGIDIKVLQYIMGHTNIAVTMEVYNHVDIERVKNELDRIYNNQKIYLTNDIVNEDDLLLDTSMCYIGEMAKRPTNFIKNISM